MSLWGKIISLPPGTTRLESASTLNKVMICSQQRYILKRKQIITVGILTSETWVHHYLMEDSVRVSKTVALIVEYQINLMSLLSIDVFKCVF